MRALLDVNVLIALLDSDHASHGAAMHWFERHAREGWASCPITENGCIRIMANAGYPNALPVQAVIKHLADARDPDLHEFWTDEISLLDGDTIDRSRIHGPRQITDIYLLALATSRGGRFVTFDGKIPLAAVRQATQKNLLVL